MPSGGGLMALLRRERVSEPWQVPWWRRCAAFGALVCRAVRARGLGALAPDPGPGALSSGAQSRRRPRRAYPVRNLCPATG